MPAYDPKEVAELARSVMTRSLADGAARTMFEELGFESRDVVWDALQLLDGPKCRFYKTVASHHDPRELLDVYHIRVDGSEREIYLKFKVITIPPGTLNRIVFVLSFKGK
jgi:hypothetical protein